jgi:hypothetical protein
MGNAPAGMFVFDRAGNYSVQLTPTGLRDHSYTAMFGRYRVDDGASTFILTAEAATDASLVGTDVVRHVTLRDDLGIFETPPFAVDGVNATTVITWRRVADPA